MSLAEPRLTARIARPDWHRPRSVVAGLTAAMTLAIVGAFSTSVVSWTPAAFVALHLVTLAGIWISGGAATALLGLFSPATTVARGEPGEDWRPSSRTAILVTLCKEDPAPLAQHLPALRAGLNRIGLERSTDIFVLSDTSGPDDVAHEEAALRPMMEDGLLTYRRRPENTGRKPGNIGNWVETHGHDFDHMLVLDADSRMSPARIRRLIWQMDRRGNLGLLQAGIALRPGHTRFGKHQRIAARLLSRSFGRGFAAWTRDSGNYWGHNAIMRVAALRAACHLPVLNGRAPWGGSVLSHDFVEAAWIRRAGWAVALDPATSGSAEEAPQTIADFHARDRRWCQGNLQHLRLLATPGLDPVSRLHLAMGVLSYLVAPIWLLLVVLITLGGLRIEGALPLAVVATVLLAPKLCALADWWPGARTARRRATVLRASLGELLVSSVIAPLVLVRQAGAVLSVAVGRDCGWKSNGREGLTLRPGITEAALGWLFLGLALIGSGAPSVWLAPIIVSLCFAPILMRVLDTPA